jgi:molecular chaperone DnaK (HSP70)
MRINFLLGVIIGTSLVTGDILSVDLGSQFFKAAIVTRGKFDIVPNLQSKRKTPTAISTKAKLREFGDDALLAQAKSPSKVATFFRWLVGSNISHVPRDELYPAAFATPFVVSTSDDRASVTYGNEDFGMRPIEDILANILWYTKNLVEEHDTPSTGRTKLGSLKDLVITVPSWATKRQRQAVIDSATIAGFSKVSLVHETSAGAVQRAQEVNASSPNNTVYFNMGSGHFEACVIQYGLVVKTPTVKVLGCAHSLKAGGGQITANLAHLGAEAFKRKHQAASLAEDPAAMVRLFRQAENVKQTLSANKETLFSVDSLWDEKDLKLHVTRTDVEKASEGVVAEIDRVVKEMLKRCNITKDDVHQVEVLGGGWRVPYIQSKLEEVFAPLPLGQHLNGDEAMVFGGAFIAANSSNSFRVPKILFTDITENDYSITIIPKTVPEGEESKWPRTQSIFPVGHKLGSSKAIKLSVNSDLDVAVLENGNLIESYLVTGARNESATEIPQIVLKVKLDSSGIFEFGGAELVREWTEEKTIRTALNTTNEKNETEYNTTTIQVPKKSKLNLSTSTSYEAKPLSMSSEQIKTSRGALKAVIETENAIKLRTKTKNDLEALVYSTVDKMEENDDVKRHSTSDERATVVAAAKRAEEWLDENGFSASVDEFKEQISALVDAAKLIFNRIDEERKQKEDEERRKKEQEELEKKAAELEATSKLNATKSINETEANSTVVPELEIPEVIDDSSQESSDDKQSDDVTTDPVSDEL